MSVAFTPWYWRQMLWERPTLGRLLDLGEENYRLLLKLVPDLRTLGGGQRFGVGEGVTLRLEVLEQTPYSSLIRLTHLFDHQGQCQSEPAALLRVYYDARQVEVVGLGGWFAAVDGGDVDRLKVKWRLGLFLSKWLAYLLAQGQGFGPAQAAAPGTCRHPGGGVGPAQPSGSGSALSSLQP